MDLRRKRTQVAAVVLAVAVLALPLVEAGPTYAQERPASSDASSPPTSDEAYAMQLRAQFGFENDLEYVRTVAQQPDATEAGLGAPLTPTEAVEIQRRGLVGAQIAGIDSIETADSTYAGAWLDQQAGGVLNIAFTTPPSTTTLDSLTSWLPSGIGSGGSNGLYKGRSTTNCDCQGIGRLPAGKATSNVLVGGNAHYHYTRLATSSNYYSERESVCLAPTSMRPTGTSCVGRSPRPTDPLQMTTTSRWSRPLRQASAPHWAVTAVGRWGTAAPSWACILG